jgi:acyl-CoA dehydrogenase
MRTIGMAEMALAATIYRAQTRKAFGKVLIDKDTIRSVIAEARIDITQTRMLCYLAASVADERGFKAAQAYIAMIKVAAPRMALRVIDEAIQVRHQPALLGCIII